MEFFTVSTLIDRLKGYKEKYGDLPILLSTDANHLFPMQSEFLMMITEKETNDGQLAVVFCDTKITDLEEEIEKNKNKI